MTRPRSAWLEEFELPEGEGTIWISGEADVALRLRDALLKRGVQRASIRFKPYWSTRGTRHRKAVDKGFV